MLEKLKLFYILVKFDEKLGIVGMCLVRLKSGANEACHTTGIGSCPSNGSLLNVNL
jgi:hypothetical protein